MKEGFLGLNFLAAWIALSLGNFFRTNFSLTSCFMGLYIEEEMFVSSSSKFLIFLPDDLPIYNSS